MGVPHPRSGWGYPILGPGRRVPAQGTPSRGTCPGYPPQGALPRVPPQQWGPAWGTPLAGAHPPRVPPWQGALPGVPPGSGVLPRVLPPAGGAPPGVPPWPAQCVLATRQAVCLLRSRRRTFLLNLNIIYSSVYTSCLLTWTINQEKVQVVEIYHYLKGLHLWRNLI